MFVAIFEHDSRLKRTTKKCVFMCSRCYSVPLCVCRAADAEEEEGGRVRQAVTSFVRCPPCISNHVSRIAVFFSTCACQEFVYERVFFFLPSRLDFFSVYLHFTQNFSLRVHGKEYKSCTTQSLVGLLSIHCSASLE